jgi:hypothetical protein
MTTQLTTTVTTTVQADAADAGEHRIVVTAIYTDDGGEHRPTDTTFEDWKLRQAHGASYRLHLLHLIRGSEEDGAGG